MAHDTHMPMPMPSNDTMDHCKPGMMSMSFHASAIEPEILFSFWKSCNVWGMLLSCFITFLIAIFLEILKAIRRRVSRRNFIHAHERMIESNSNNTNSSGAPVMHRNTVKDVIRKNLTLPHLLQSVLYGAQVLIGMLLMLIFMTYNVWLCIALVVGAVVGFVFFGDSEHHADDYAICH